MSLANVSPRHAFVIDVEPFFAPLARVLASPAVLADLDALARPVTRGHPGPGSLAPLGPGLDYAVVTRSTLVADTLSTVSRLGPALDHIHRHALPAIVDLARGIDRTASYRADEALIPITADHGLTLNTLTSTPSPGEELCDPSESDFDRHERWRDAARWPHLPELEWHLDGPNVECVAVLSIGRAWGHHDGGRFLIHDGQRVEAIPVHPLRALVCFTSSVPHAVEMIDDCAAQRSRRTLMFAFTTSERQLSPQARRDADADSYLFEAPDPGSPG